eukprot:TRINITY_DN2198_c0_g1_i11.p1 TRINITY_DN2198_c0_g1~~TRINITY_DN2198_c0_g1_i11.p1  ORF type:complete len:420 (-),score=30.18 TRINITY_DN2198_c0_g1_i11:330-1589(-)
MCKSHYLSTLPRTRVVSCFIFFLVIIILSIFKSFLYIYLAEFVDGTFVSRMFDCTDVMCYQISSVRRLSFGYACFHFVLALLTICKKDGQPYEWQLKLHHKFWILKILMLFSIMALTFLLIPKKFYDIWAYMEAVGSGFFLLIEAILLVDFAYVWYETWASHDSEFYNIFIHSVTAILFLMSLGVAIFFGSTFSVECISNIAALSETCVVCFFLTLISLHSRIERGSPFISAFVTLFCICLTCGAMVGKREAECTVDQSSSFEAFYIVIACVFSLVTICYNSLHYLVVHRSFVTNMVGINEDPASSTDSTFGFMDVNTSGSIGSRMLMSSPTPEIDSQMHYNLTQFHITFVFGAMFLGMVFSNWNLSSTGGNSVGNLIFWVQFSVQCITTLLYTWSLIAPLVLKSLQYEKENDTSDVEQ